jgi:hypothetical protein
LPSVLQLTWSAKLQSSRSLSNKRSSPQS